MFTSTRGTPASSALSIAIRSALGSTRTDSVASTTGRARVGAAAGPARSSLRSASFGISPKLGTKFVDVRPWPMVQGRCTNWYDRWPLSYSRRGTVHGACRGRGEATPQGDDVVGRLRGRPRQPRVPDRRTGLL